MKEIIVDVFNEFYDAGRFTEVWKAVRLTFIPKAGERDLTSPKDYMPIRIPPILGKTYERIMANRIYDYEILN